MNKWIGHGRLAKDVEMRYTSTGKAVASFTIAVNSGYGNDAKTEFIPCIAWEKTAQIIGDNLAKGSEVLVEGRIQIRSYDAKDGSKRYVTEIIVTSIEFCGSKKDNGQKTEGISGQPVSDMDIPF